MPPDAVIPGDKPCSPWRRVSALKKTLREQQIYFDNWEPGWKSWVKAGLAWPWAWGGFQPGIPVRNSAWDRADVRVLGSPSSAWASMGGSREGLRAVGLGCSSPASSFG